MFWRPLVSIAAAGALLQVPQFRAGVTLVPVEVRVVDRDFNSIRDLKASEFSISEDGRRQSISHFETVSVGGQAAAPRTFLIVLGRGRLNEPTRAVEALAGFARSLGPNDRIAVFAYNKVIEFTANRTEVARFLDTFRDAHVGIEGRLANDRLTSLDLPVVSAATRQRIEDLLGGNPALQVTDLAAGDGNAWSRYTSSHYLRTALGYLITVPGEKHVILLTERFFPPPRQSDDPVENYWFRLATSSRSSLSFIHTGGMPSPSTPLARFVDRGESLTGQLARQSLRSLADQLGGISAAFQYADQPLGAIERATRFHYVIGYYPTHDTAPNQFRRIEIAVSRPGARVLYRHGFQARPESPDKAADYREVATDARTEEAAARILHAPSSSGPEGFSWEMRLSAHVGHRSTTTETLNVTVAFDPRFVMFTKAGSTYRAELDLKLLADTEDGRTLKTERRRLDIVLSEAEHSRTKRQWPTFDFTCDVPRGTTSIRAVLFQFETDRTAARRASIRR